MKGDTMILKVVGERLLVKQQPIENEEAEALEGVVIAVGNGRLTESGRIAPTVQVGDHVYYGKYVPTQVTYMGVDYRIIREDDVLLFWRE